MNDEHLGYWTQNTPKMRKDCTHNESKMDLKRVIEYTYQMFIKIIIWIMLRTSVLDEYTVSKLTRV